MNRANSKRIRIFAGPNGSGKTTIIKAIRKNKKVPLGYYVNADDIENVINRKKKLLLANYGIHISNPTAFYFFSDNHGLHLRKKIPDLRPILKINSKSIVLKKNQIINSYVAALIADFLREELLNANTSFSFETVMSDKRKLNLAERAKKNGYRVYLYFVATTDPNINIERVSQRVELGGHKVDPDLIRKRYENSLLLLYKMVKLTDRAYLFDNSGQKFELIAEITSGEKVLIRTYVIPNWFYHNFYLKAIRHKKPNE